MVDLPTLEWYRHYVQAPADLTISKDAAPGIGAAHVYVSNLLGKIVYDGVAGGGDTAALAWALANVNQYVPTIHINTKLTLSGPAVIAKDDTELFGGLIECTDPTSQILVGYQATSTNRVKIHDMHIYNSGGGGDLFLIDAKDVIELQIQNVRINNANGTNHRGISVYNQMPTAGLLKIINCDVWGGSISINAVHDSIISGTFVNAVDSEYGIKISTANGVRIINSCHVVVPKKTAGTAGIWYDGVLGGAIIAAEIDGTQTHSTAKGIYLNAAGSVRVIGSNLYNMAGHALHVRASNRIDVAHNTFSNNNVDDDNSCDVCVEATAWNANHGIYAYNHHNQGNAKINPGYVYLEVNAGQNPRDNKLICPDISNPANYTPALYTMLGLDCIAQVEQLGVGYDTKTSGTATILNATAAIVVAHGLHNTPDKISVAGSTADSASLYVDTIGAANFTINAQDGVVGANRSVYWEAACRI